MGLPVRLITRGTYGVCDPRGYGFGFSGESGLNAALRSGGAAKSLLFLDNLENKSERGTLGVTMRGRIVWQDGDNLAENWTALEGGTYLEEWPNPFGDGTPGLSYSRSLSSSDGVFISNASLIDEDTPFAIRFRLYKIQQEYPVRTIRVPNSLFQIEIAKSQVRMQLRTAAWTQADEESLHTMLADTSISDVEQQAIDTLRTTLYAVEKQIDLPGDIYETHHTLIFFPEQRGVISAFDEQFRFLAQIEDADILDSRADGSMWGDSPLWVRSNGPALDWQFGRWVSPTRSQLRLGRYRTQTSGSWTFQMLKSTSGTSTCTMANETINDVYDEVVVNFTCDGTAPPPVFYAGYAYRAPGTRTQLNHAVTLDTDNLADSSCIKDCTPTFEEFNKRVCYRLAIRDIGGAFTTALATGLTGTGLEFGYPALENLVCDLWIGGVRVLKNGIIKESAHGNMKHITANQTPATVIRDNNTLAPLICDQWQILDERVLEEVLPVGDGMKLGAYLRDLLKLVGLDTSEMTGVNATAGRTLPSARPGESWAIQPQKGTTLGDWIRHLLDLWSMGKELWIDADGVWNFGARSTTAKFTLSVGATVHRTLNPLASVRDSCDVYNFFRVEGDEDAYGVPISATWQVSPSIFPPGNPGNPLYIGRIKAYPTMRESGVKTQSDADWVVRSLVRAHCKPGRIYQFSTFWRNGVYPGDRVNVHGFELEVVRIEGGSTAAFASDNSGYEGKMDFSVREVVSVG